VLGETASVRLLPNRVDFAQMREKPLADLVAGLTVAIVALPLALAFGIGSGLGAGAGITSAIFAGALAAIFGGSRVQVSGPTGAMTVILIPIFHSAGASGVLLVGLMAGLLLVLFAWLKLGDHIHRLPTALIEGFTAGIAVVIALQQLPFILGLPATHDDRIWQQALNLLNQAGAAPNWTPIATALAVAASILLIGKFLPRLPFALLAVIIATVLADSLQLKLDRIGTLPASVGEFQIDFLYGPWLTLIPSAIAVALLAALESLLSAKIADKMTGQHHDSNREIFGQGIANLVTPFFGGVPATAALARTAVNVRSHAHSRLASLIHAATLAIAVLLIAGLVERIPLAALAGVLIATTARMINPEELKKLAAESKNDAAVLWVTFFMTVATDLITAVIVGLLLSLLLRKSRFANLDRRYPPVNKKETLGD
jgi:sulfate permease, SulP family